MAALRQRQDGTQVVVMSWGWKVAGGMGTVLLMLLSFLGTATFNGVQELRTWRAGDRTTIEENSRRLDRHDESLRDHDGRIRELEKASRPSSMLWDGEYVRRGW